MLPVSFTATLADLESQKLETYDTEQLITIQVGQLEKEKKAREEKLKKGEEVPEETVDDTTDLKLRYYEQQIVLAKHDDKYLDVCKHYRQVLDTEHAPAFARPLGASLPGRGQRD